MKKEDKTIGINSVLKAIFKRCESGEPCAFNVDSLNNTELAESLCGKMIVVYGKIDTHAYRETKLWINSNLKEDSERPQIGIRLHDKIDIDDPDGLPYLAFGTLNKNKDKGQQGGYTVYLDSNQHIYIEKKKSS